MVSNYNKVSQVLSRHMETVEQSNPDWGIHQFNQPFAAVFYESMFLHLFLLYLELLILKYFSIGWRENLINLLV